MNEEKKEGRYRRIEAQLAGLMARCDDPLARMATICAVLHHKMDHYFWTGFYRMTGERLVVGPYQGPLACQELKPHTGVCWAAADGRSAVVVPDVHAFPGHIACDSRSRSEITLPVFGPDGQVEAVLDVDSDRAGAFSDTDRIHLEQIAAMVYGQINPTG